MKLGSPAHQKIAFSHLEIPGPHNTHHHIWDWRVILKVRESRNSGKENAERSCFEIIILPGIISVKIFLRGY